MSISIKKDLRQTFGLARNQHSRPTCLAFATSDAHASLRKGWTPLSAEFAFFHAQRRSSRSLMVGATLGGMAEALRADGQPAETEWAYSPTLPADISTWPPKNIVHVFRRNGSVARNSVDEIIGHIENDTPPIIAMMISDRFYLPVNGTVDTKSGEAVADARQHAVIAVAHGSNATQRVILIRNSWGSSWGSSGYAWITESYLRPRLLGAIILEGDTDALVDRAAA